MSIISLGIGSGLDLNNLVDRILTAEREPKENRLNRREADLQARISAFGTLRGGLDKLDVALARLANLGEGRTVTSSDSTRLSANATEAVAPGRYTVEIEQLAAAHSLASGAFGSQDSVVGTGTLSLRVGNGPTVNLTIDETSNSLRGVRDAINQTDAGVRASIVNDGSGARLVLTSEKSGAANTISLTVNDSDGNHTDLSGLSRLASANLQETMAARDARVVLNGLTVTSASNTLDTTVEGLTLELQGVTEPGSTITIEVGQDRAAIREALNEVIAAYNGVIEQINGLTAVNAETGEAGLLVGDSTMRGIRSRLSAALVQPGGRVDGLFSNLVNLGVRSGEQGLLSLDEAALERALNQDLSGSVALLNDVAGGMQNVVLGFTDRGGLLDNRTEGLQGDLREISRQRDILNQRMERMEAQMVRQFGALDALVGQLQNTSEFLDQQFSSLNAMLADRRRR